MKNIKRVLALAVCFIMLLQVGVVFAEDFGVTVSEETLQEDLELLNALGILEESYSDITLNYKVTRMDFAVTMARIFGNSVADGETEPESYYTDMEGMGVEAVKAVNLLTDRKIISGTGNNEFQPETAISYEQAVKILVCALGYEMIAVEYGGFPNGFLIEGARLGVTDGISLLNTDSLTWAGFICLMNNILSIDLMERTVYGDNPTYEIVEGDTLLNSVMNIQLLENVTVTANQITNLHGDEGVNSGYVEINGVLFSDPDGLAGSYIGKRVDVYYRENRFGVRTIIYIRASYDSFSILLDDIVSVDGYKITYYDEASENNKTVRVADDATLILNGQVFAYMAEAIDLTKSGRIILERNASSASYDVITAQIYTNMIVAAVDYEKKIIYDKIVDGKSLDLSNYIANNRCDIQKDGVSTDINGIKTDAILAVYDTPNNGYISITVSDNKVTGELDSYTSEKVIIGGVSYDFDDSLQEQIEGRLGSIFTAYLDVNNVIIWFSTASGTSLKYGYLIAGAVKSGIDSRLLLRILTEDGVIDEYTLASKVSLNDTDISKNVPSTVQNQLCTGGAWNQQLIQYSLNSNGEINLLNTAKAMQGVVPNQLRDKDFYCSVSKSELKYKSGKKSFYGKFSIDDNTKIFIVSKDNSSDLKDYAIGSTAYFINDYSYTVAAYNTDGGGKAAALVCWDEVRNITPDNRSDMVMVDYISTGLDADGNEIQQLHGLMNGKYVEYNTDYDANVKLSTGTRDLKRGDVIRIALNSKSEISGIYVDVDIDTQKTSNASLSTFWNVYWAISGAFYSKENGYAIISNTNAESLSSIFESPNSENLYSITISGTIMIYDEEQDSIYAGTESDILTYEAAGESASRFFMRFNYESVSNIFIFKYSSL